MSTRRYLALVGAMWALALSAHAQGTLVNLDFESPLLPLVPVDSQVPITSAMPGWNGYIGGVPVSRVVYDTLSLGAAAISIQDANGSINVIQGNYTVYLQPSFPSGTVWPAIGQVGTIPNGA